jgi:hypothetical protein
VSFDVSRRGFLATAGATGLMAFMTRAQFADAMVGAPHAGEPGRFLSAAQLDTLRAVTDRLMPGPPEDPDPGALDGRSAEAIDMLLGAFSVDPPLIFAGGPWSNRAGGATDHMAKFIALDPIQELGWRIRLEGSRGMKEREFAGPVVGLQEQYQNGLAALDTLAGQHGSTTGFVGLSNADRATVMMDGSVGDFVGQALTDTINAMYGPPEYGGNANLVGWKAVHWPGDTQPRGFTAAEVSQPDADRRTLAYTADQTRQLANQLLPGSTILD